MSSGKQNGFNDSFVSKHVHPSAITATSTTPDEELERNENLFHRSKDEIMARKTAELCTIIDFIIASKIKAGDSRYYKAIALRAIAVAWAINPDALTNGFDYAKNSLRKIAGSLGIKTTQLSRVAAEFARQMKSKNKWQSHDWRN